MFDAAFAEALRTRYEGELSLRRPGYWLIATAEDRAEQRAWINRALALLPEPGRSKLWHRLLENAHFLQTYNELAVAAILQSAGLSPRYEVEWGEQTPDFTLFDAAGGPRLILEVVSRLPSKARSQMDKTWQSLRDRVRKIPAPYILRVLNLGSSPDAPPERLAKQIVPVLGDWLRQEPRTLGTTITIEGYRFIVGAQLPAGNADLIYPQNGDWFNSDDLRDIVKEKARKYAPLADRLEVPLVIVVGADPRVPVDLDMLRSMVNGQLTTSLSIDPFFAGPTKSKPVKMHMVDTPPAFAPALAAVGWLKADTDEPGALTLLPSAQGVRPHGLAATRHMTIG